MNNNPTSNIVSVLKQKMTDTRDEVAKYKEKILDLENSMQAEVDRKEIATTEACRLNERMAVLEEKLAEVKDATRTANEKTAELSKTGEEAIRQARVLKNTTNAEDEKPRHRIRTTNSQGRARTSNLASPLAKAWKVWLN